MRHFTDTVVAMPRRCRRFRPRISLSTGLQVDHEGMEVHALRLIQPNGVTSLVTVRIAEPRPHDGVSICDVQLAGLRPHPALIRGSSPQAARIRARAWCEQALRDEQQRGARIVQALDGAPWKGFVRSQGATASNAAERQRRRSQVVPLVLMGGTIVIGAATAGTVISTRPRLDPLRPVAGATYRPGARGDERDDDDQAQTDPAAAGQDQQGWFAPGSGSGPVWHQQHSVGTKAPSHHDSATSTVSRGGFGSSSHSFGAGHSSGG